MIANFSKFDIDNIVSELLNLLIDSAKETFGTRIDTGNTRIHDKKNKDWYTSDCHKAKKELRKSQRLYKKHGSCLFKERLRRSERFYKKLMNSCIQNYNDELSNKMHRLNSTNPKEFGKYLIKMRRV